MVVGPFKTHLETVSVQRSSAKGPNEWNLVTGLGVSCVGTLPRRLDTDLS